MPRSEAQKRADKKYDASGKNKYRTIGTRVHLDQLKQIQATAEAQDLTVSRFMLNCAMYCIQHDIDLSDN